MARPAEQRGPQTSTVSACSARDCMHNEEGECHAGSIRVEMREGGAICATYNPEPKARP
jgi:hypothetical protein